MRKTANRSNSEHRRSPFQRLSKHHRRLHCEMLEDRLMLTTTLSVTDYTPMGAVNGPVTAVNVTFNNIVNQGSITPWDIGIVKLDDVTVSQVGQYNITSPINYPYPSISNCVIDGDRLYAATSDGLQILNVSNPTRPTLLGSYHDTLGWTYGLAVQGNYVYIADYENGLQILNVAQPSNPVMVGYYNAILSQARDIKVGNYVMTVNDVTSIHQIAFVACYDGGVQIFDVTVPDEIPNKPEDRDWPHLLASIDTPGNACNIEIVGSQVYVADEDGGLQRCAFNTNDFDPENPLSLTSETVYAANDVVDLAIVDNHAYLAVGYSGLKIIDLGSLDAYSYNTPGFATGVSVVGDLVFVADGAAGMRVLNASDLLDIQEIGSYDTASWTCDTVTITGGLAYVADDTGGLRVLKFGEEIDRSGLIRASDTSYVVKLLDPLEDSEYAIVVGPEIWDLGHRRMDQDQDYLYGFGGKDAFYAEFDGFLAADSDISLSNSAIDENEPADTLVGTLNATVPGVDETFTYYLINENGSPDTSSPFTIDGDELRSSAIFDYETTTEYALRVRAVYNGVLYVDKEFTIAVNNLPSRPTSLTLDGDHTINESMPLGTVIGTFSTLDSDPVPNETFTYTLPSGVAYNNYFSIVGNNTLVSAHVFDYEAGHMFRIHVISSNQYGEVPEDFDISVNNLNSVPTAITLDGSYVAHVAENGAAVVNVGALSTMTSDPDPSDVFTYVFATDATDHDRDNSAFTLENGVLRTKFSLDYELQQEYFVLIQSSNQNGSVTQAFTIIVTNVNETPSGIAMSGGTLAENQPIGTTVGTLSTTDPDAGNTFTYSLVAGEGGADNASFTINGSTLKANAGFNYEAKHAYSVRVRSTDQGGLYTEQAFTVNVTDVYEVSYTTIGLYAPASSMFYLRNTNTTGVADLDFMYGPAGAGWKPISGDWNGDGTDTIALYKTTNSVFYLRDANTTGVADSSFIYLPGTGPWMPIVGDWDGDGDDTVGLYNPTTSRFFLHNDNASGYADALFTYGPANNRWIPVVGDWNSDRVDTVGLYDPVSSIFYLRDTNTTGVADTTLVYGPGNQGWLPVCGDWDGDGDDTIGLYNPQTSTFYLRNLNTTGVANITFIYGPSGAGWLPIAGTWTGEMHEPTSAPSTQLGELIQDLYNDGGGISRNDAIQILQSTVASTSDGGGTITQSELDDCQMMVSNATTWNMPDYVKVLTGNVVSTNPANAHYQGGSLGNLAVGDTTTKLTSLVNKWFKGTDHPTLTDAAYTYQTAAGSLFVGGPSINDMNQGGLGDCYFISSLGSIANVNSTAITNMFIDNGDNTWTVRFYYTRSGLVDGTYTADYVTVDKQLPTNGGYLVYASAGGSYLHPAPRSYNDSANELWIALAEKAYAQWNETGRASRETTPTNQNGLNSYASIAAGFGQPLAQILGDSAKWYNIGYDGTEAVLKGALDADKAVLIGTKHSLADWQDGLIGGHMYVVASYTNDTFTLYNPWGYNENNTPMSLELSWSVLNADCDSFFTSNTVWNSGTWNSASRAFRRDAGATDHVFANTDSLFDHDFILGAKIVASSLLPVA